MAEIVSLALSWAFVAASIWKLSEYIDSMLSPQGQSALAAVIAKSNLQELLSGASKAFLLASDAVFGERLFSLRSLLVSMLCSTIALLCLSLIWFSMAPQLFGMLWNDGLVRMMPHLFLWLNILPDFFSVVETRLLIRLSQKVRSTFLLFLLLLLDLFAKVLIYTAGWYLWLMWGALQYKELSSFHGSYILLVKEVLEQVSSFGPKFIHDGFWFPSFLAIFAFTTLFSSVWIWLYVLGIGVTQIARRADVAWSSAKVWMDLQTKPARWLGAIAVLCVTLLYLIFGVVLGIANWV